MGRGLGSSVIITTRVGLLGLECWLIDTHGSSEVSRVVRSKSQTGWGISYSYCKNFDERLTFDSFIDLV